MNWDPDRGRTPTSSRLLKKAFRRAEALDRIHVTDRAKTPRYMPCQLANTD